ncbi:MAG: hypothetical protein ACTTKF_08285, partial [Bacteroides sp.]
MARCGPKGGRPSGGGGAWGGKMQITEARHVVPSCEGVSKHNTTFASIHYAPYGAGRSMLRPYEPHHS